MPSTDNVRADKLIDLARDRFDQSMSPGELEVLRDVSGAVPKNTNKRLPVRSDFIRWLLTDPETSPYLPENGIRIQHARILSALNLYRCHVGIPLQFTGCTFDDVLHLEYANIVSLMFDSSELVSGISAAWIQAQESVTFLRCECRGVLEFRNAHIAGNFVCDTVSLDTHDTALDLDLVVVDGDIFVPGCRSSGALIMRAMRVSGEVNLKGAILDVSGIAVQLDGCQIGSHVILEHVKSTGTLSMSGMQVEGVIDLKNAVVDAPKDAIQIAGAKIGGDLVLESVTSAGTISLNDTRVNGSLSCGGADLRSTGDTLLMMNTNVGNSVFLSPGFHSAGTIRAGGMQVGGVFELSGARLQTKGTAIDSVGVVIKGEMNAVSLQSSGSIYLNDMNVGGNLLFQGAQLEATQNALIMDGAILNHNVFLRDGFRTDGPVSMSGAQIIGDLDCSAATFNSPTVALRFDRAIIKGNVFLRRISQGEFRSSGQISGHECRVDGAIDATGAKFTGKSTMLELEGATIKGSLIADSAQCDGTINVNGGFLGGNLQFNGTHFMSSLDALLLEGTNIQQSALLGNGFKSNGRVDMTLAQIGGDLNCTGGCLLSAKEGLRIDRAAIRGNVFLRSDLQGEFSCAGEVRAIHAKIGGDLDCTGALIGTLICNQTTIGGSWIWTEIRNGGKCEVFLVGASLGGVDDDRLSWPGAGKLHLTGLSYNGLGLHKTPTKKQLENSDIGDVLPLVPADRVAWLRLQPDDEIGDSQPWMELANFLQMKGNPAGARYVIHEYQLEQTQLATQRAHGWHRQVWRVRGPGEDLASWLLESPWRSIEGIVGLWLFGSLVFWRYKRMMVPRDPDAYEGQRRNGELPPHYLRFHPAMYSLENVLPVIKLGQDAVWQADPGPRAPARGTRKRNRLRKLFPRFDIALSEFWPCYVWVLFVHGIRVIWRSLKRLARMPRRMWTVLTDIVFLKYKGNQQQPWVRTRGSRYLFLSAVRWGLIFFGWVLAILFAAAVTKYYSQYFKQ